ncbi:amino acid permease [Rickettsiales endosymbiont of Stachyamoeba lipophora]|uniref:amino acid permease n=1 Tax=Rickettsiales endosymbiont of Stachyamoeba lipophora TaxID=2486578 RepID=UPI000F64FC28|nr:amino acid permease [Rickettsiales endosymbiont of Stachyamoeba lipophora]AZL15262.1 amino acid permease [Rickettsiales endosymbiont of Stachyamoeba lipophora]
MSLLRKIDLTTIKAEFVENNLKKTLTVTDLTMLSIGAIIGVGAFVLTGIAAAKFAGPAIVLSYLLAGIVCILTGLLYLELAAIIPTSGSSYSYAYASMGEIVAWIVFWFMMMEYTTGSSLIAIGWGGYINGILESGYGIFIPKDFLTTPWEGGIINLPPVLITLVLTMLLIKGTKESSIINIILVVIKTLALILFVVFAFPNLNFEYWENFMPFGAKGLVTGTATVILAYVGFDALASATEESINPKRDLPIAIIVSLLICILIYMSVSASLTLIVPYYTLDNAEPMAYALRAIGNKYGAIIIAVGAVAGITTSLIVQIFGQSRVLFAIARDGLIPNKLSVVHKRYHTPYISTVFVGIIIALVAGLVPLEFISKLASIGILVSFLTVAIGVLIFRIKIPTFQRSFKCPLVWIVAPLSFIICMYLLSDLLVTTWDVCLVWLVLGIIFYFAYGYKNSKLNNLTE